MLAYIYQFDMLTGVKEKKNHRKYYKNILYNSTTT